MERLVRSATVVVAIFCSIVVDVASWTDSELRWFDNVRSLETVDAETRPGSNVVRVSLPRTANESVEPGDMPNGRSDVRLCNLAVMIGDTVFGKRIAYASFPSKGAMLLALLHFNHKIDSVVPALTKDPVLRDCNVKLTMDHYDTQMSPKLASEIYLEQVLQRNHSLSNPSPCAVIGGGLSSTSAQLSTLSSMFGIPTISGISLSPELDNKDRFRMFGRTIPTDRGLSIAVADYFRQTYNVTHCAVLYVKDEWGRAVNQEFMAAARAMNPPMKVASISYDPTVTDEEVNRALQQLEESGFNYVFAAISPKGLYPILGEGSKRGLIGPGKYWMLTPASSNLLLDTFKFDHDSQFHQARASHGINLMTHDLGGGEAFGNAWTTLETDKALKAYFLERQTEKVNFTGFQFESVPAPWFQFSYDAVMAVGIAACRAKEEFFQGEALFEEFMKTDFVGASGNVKINNKTGSRDAFVIGHRVTNIIAREPDENNQVGFDRTLVARQTKGEGGKIAWEITNPTTFADSTTNPPLVLPPVTRTYIRIGPGVQRFGWALAALIMLESLMWIGWTIWNRDARIVRSAQPEFLVLLCIGTLIMSSAVIPLSLQEPISRKGLNVACMATPWLAQIGFITSFSALLAKMQRINKVFLAGRFRRVVVTPRDVMAPFLSLLSCTVIVLTTWTIVDPLVYQDIVVSLDRFGRDVSSYGACSPSSPYKTMAFVIPLVLIDVTAVFFANYQSFRARRISSEFSESRFVAMSMASLLQAFILGVPVFGVVMRSANPSGFFLVATILLTLVCSGILIPIFVPKKLAMMGPAKSQARKKNSTPSGVVVYKSPLPRVIKMSAREDEGENTNEVTVENTPSAAPQRNEDNPARRATASTVPLRDSTSTAGKTIARLSSGGFSRGNTFSRMSSGSVSARMSSGSVTQRKTAEG